MPEWRPMRFRRILGIGFAAVVVAVGLGVGILYASHPRDEPAFLRAMENSWNKELRTSIEKSPEQVVGEGDRSCAWLEGQRWAVPDLSGDVSGDVTGDDLLTRYSRETRGDERLSFSAHRDRMVRYIAFTAWRDLCGVTFELRHTHHPLVSPG